MNTFKQEMHYRAGFVGLIGQPNAGKSSLFNILVDEKISIVTEKPQTTRRRMIGIVSVPKTAQVIFVDAPGLIRAKNGLNAFLEKEALDVIHNSDVLLGVVSLDEKRKEGVIEILHLLKDSKKPFVTVITKSDQVQYNHRIRIIQNLVNDFAKQNKINIPVVEFSNKWGMDTKKIANELISEVVKLLPESSGPLYELDVLTTHSMRELVIEVIREKCFEKLSQEVPYQLTVRIIKFDESNPDKPKIYADIITNKESHKKIIIGRNAKNVKWIGSKARVDIERMMGKKVFLKLEVIVRENWTENKKMMKEFGYVVDSNS